MERLIEFIKLSKHLISYARNEKWLHDEMDKRRDRSQWYKKAMRYYILNAGDPEFSGVRVPVDGQPIQAAAPVPRPAAAEVRTAPDKQPDLDSVEVVEDTSQYIADIDELSDIMGSGGTL